MTRSNGRGDPEALREEIRRTRAELGETARALAAKADVKARIRESAAQGGRRIRSRAGHTAATVRTSLDDGGAVARRHPIPLAGLAAGVLVAGIVFLVLRRRRR